MLLYSLKLLRTKIFMDFMVFEAHTKILSLKISYRAKYVAIYEWRVAYPQNFYPKNLLFLGKVNTPQKV